MRGVDKSFTELHQIQAQIQAFQEPNRSLQEKFAHFSTGCCLVQRKKLLKENFTTKLYKPGDRVFFINYSGGKKTFGKTALSLKKTWQSDIHVQSEKIRM